MVAIADELLLSVRGLNWAVEAEVPLVDCWQSEPRLWSVFVRGMGVGGYTAASE
jgi:hypothetical protein